HTRPAGLPRPAARTPGRRGTAPPRRGAHARPPLPPARTPGRRPDTGRRADAGRLPGRREIVASPPPGHTQGTPAGHLAHGPLPLAPSGPGCDIAAKGRAQSLVAARPASPAPGLHPSPPRPGAGAPAAPHRRPPSPLSRRARPGAAPRGWRGRDPFL